MTLKHLSASIALCLSLGACAAPVDKPTDASVDYIPALQQGEAVFWLALDDSGQLRVENGKAIARDVSAVNIVQVSDGYLVATIAGVEATPTLYLLRDNAKRVERLATLASPNFLVEGLCLAPEADGSVSLFMLDERGSAEQWVVYSDKQSLTPAQLRTLPIAPNATACAADGNGGLFIAEEEMGVWRYSSNAEKPVSREVVGLASPYGELGEGTEAIAYLGNNLVTVTVDTAEVHVHQPSDNGWSSTTLGQWQGIEEPEQLRAWYNAKDGQLHLQARDDASGEFARKSFAVAGGQLDFSAPAASEQSVKLVQPSVQTDPVARFGDAADDPAIWVHPQTPEKSLILGTDKKHGLLVYTLDGKQKQLLPTGRLNNVDLRYGFDFGNGIDDIAVATQRDDNSLSIYRVDAENGHIQHVAELPTGLEEIYGFCMYQNGGNTYAIANGKSGTFEQYLLQADNGKISASLARTFAVETQPEGCVADDATGQLFVGEEGVGVYTLSANPEAGDAPVLIRGVDEIMVADVEGMALYPAENSRYLIVSSQGDDSYVVLQSSAPYKVLGKFRVGANYGAGIDAISETDGLEVTHRSLGKGYEQGAFIAQDGHNVMPERPQNFKLVPWSDIAQELNLND
ncbi:phytase [Gilvimarinus chinensis]|uniref:phytase n=1 Tax=Gilvimarinus chinensis TaxID=396005 RepID=UPI000365142F|nr:phytase [Gilvimarinus chinensis]